MAGKILKFLPKAASFSIPNHNSSSNKSSKHMFSGPIVPMIPEHCRRKSSGMLEEEEEEPTSPKVSCIGQVNNNKKSSNSRRKKKMMKLKKEKEEELLVTRKEEEQRKKKAKEAPKRTSSIGGMFWRSKAAKPARRLDVHDSSDDEAVAAPGIGRMRSYASGRETLKDFDWRTIVQNNDELVVEEEEKEAEEQMVPHSAPILVGGGAVALEPKKEMNIWRRRTITPPVPLQVN
ncbi:uncharacterized protein M6B38_194680 [Iris pallida]|uniref:Uncharacterized protein n=1 Tax=Iris pallida TaxID=29817 RepID=A0AAX6EDT5_IRIPA|nr:uncharacterized protein M6B38_194680 [Iris pallida]